MRLDQAMVARGLMKSRARAQAAIADGLVAVDGQVVRKAARPISDDDTVALVGAPLQWVSRAALKLEHGLKVFDVDVTGVEALDIGASTGGFSEVLLAKGAAHVTAIDVGHGQLDATLHGHPKLTYLEGINAKDLAGADIPSPDFIVCDVSFIALRKALPAALSMACAGAKLLTLVKPQFELERAQIGKNGVVKDRSIRASALDAVVAFVEDAGWQVDGTCDSPITGADGNHEFLLFATKPA